MKVAFNRQIKRSPWGGGAHFHSAMVDALTSGGHTVTDRLEDDVDVVFMLDPRHEDGGFDWKTVAHHKGRFPRTKVLHRVNECDARNGGVNNIDALLVESNSIADRTVFISNWLRDHLSGKGLRPRTSDVVYNGCRLQWFRPTEDKAGLKERKIKLVTHHWSDNRLKGFDLYDALDKYVEKYPQFEFTYIGRYNKEYSPRNTRVLSPMYGKELGDELREHDIYVTASKNEPAGMHHVEGAASGLPVLFHADGGGIVECASKHGLSFHDASSFHRSLDAVVQRYDEYRNMIDRDELSIDVCCERYLEILKSMVEDADIA